VLEHELIQKVADILGKIMRPNKEIKTMSNARVSFFRPESRHDPLR
jgi:hypothetical protein